MSKASVSASVSERIVELAKQVYGPGPATVVTVGAEASVVREGELQCTVTAFDGDALGALERFLERRLPSA